MIRYLAKNLVLRQEEDCAGEVWKNCTRYVDKARTQFRSSVEVTRQISVKVGLYQRSALSSFLFAFIMNVLAPGA